MKIFHLEMNAPDELVPATSPLQPTLQPVSPPDPATNQRFYREVGTGWDWNDRATWSLDQWAANLAANPISTLTLHHNNATIGYSELLLAGGDIEIVYFGLLPQFIGHGLGGTSLEAVTRHAWSLPGTRRVWLHTCEADHPTALANYQRRGFKHFKTEHS